MERNNQKNGLVNLVVVTLVFIAALATAFYVNSLAGIVAVVFLGLGVLVTLMGWFQGRLEENERLEKLELDELARSRGDTSLFDSKESEVFPAKSSREQFEKYFVPGFCILLLILEAGSAGLLWRWIGKAGTMVDPTKAVASAVVFFLCLGVLFLLGRFSVTLARLENSRLLRPSASFLLAGAYVCLLTALAICGNWFNLPWADLLAARIFCILLALMAVEQLLTLLLEIYRPRVKGKISRPLYDGRIVGLLAQPEDLFTTAAQTLDYQFGFKVSETWFFQLLKRNIALLLLVQLAVLALSTCFVFVSPGEQVVLEHFGKPVATLQPGGHVKLPWPWDKAYRFKTDQIQSLYVGFTPDEGRAESKVILWTVAHDQEQNFLVGSTQPPASNQNSDTNNAARTPPVSLISVSIPVQYQITNVIDWAYHNTDPTNLLADLASREVVHYLAGEDMDQIMSKGRFDAARELQSRIQSAADAHQLGAVITFVGLQDIHPPTAVAKQYEEVINAKQLRYATNLMATSHAIVTNAIAMAKSFSTNSAAEAAAIQLEASAFARAGSFTNQVMAFNAAPSIYKQRLYYTAFADATANSRKYLLLVTNTHNVLIYNLEQSVRDDIVGLKVPNEK